MHLNKSLLWCPFYLGLGLLPDSDCDKILHLCVVPVVGQGFSIVKGQDMVCGSSQGVLVSIGEYGSCCEELDGRTGEWMDGRNSGHA